MYCAIHKLMHACHSIVICPRLNVITVGVFDMFLSLGHHNILFFDDMDPFTLILLSHEFIQKMPQFNHQIKGAINIIQL